MPKRRSKYSARARKFVARKIRTLAHEGIEAPRRVAASLSMARARGLKVPRKPNPYAEPANEHVRNALMLLNGMDEKDPVDVLKVRSAVMMRLRLALDQLESRGGVTTRLRSNPTLAILGANPRVEDATIATWAKIEYMRPDDPDGRDIVRVHEFSDGFEIAWLSDGSVQLSHPKHPLWVEDHE